MTKRRGNNEGSISQRENGNWRAQISIEGKRLSFTAATRKECLEWIRQTSRQINEGYSIAGGKISLNQYYASWLETVNENRRKKTYIQYKSIVNQYIVPEFGKLQISDLKPNLIEKFLVKLQQRNLDRTAQIIYSVLHVSLEKAQKQGLISRNPMLAVEKPKIKNSKQKIILDVDQIQQLLVAAEGHRISFLIHFSIITGLREAELFGLQWKDVDWNKNAVHIVRQAQRFPGEGIVFSSPKTLSGIRTVVLGKMTMQKLKEHQENQLVEKEIAGENWNDLDLIFPSKRGTVMDPGNLLKEFKIILKRAELPIMRFHDLRHTSITLVLNEIGAPLKEAQKRAGHASPITTIEIYGGETTSKLDEIVAEGLDELVTPIKFELHPNCTKEKSLPYF